MDKKESWPTEIIEEQKKQNTILGFALSISLIINAILVTILAADSSN